MTLKIVDTLSSECSNRLFKWADVVFPEEGKDFEWASSTWHIVAFDHDNQPCAHLGFAAFDITLDSDKSQKVVGVGGVVVRPEYQGKNIPKKMFSALHSSAQATATSDIFTLFCPPRLVSYYQKHGYAKFEGLYTFVQFGKTVSTDKFILMYYGGKLEADNIHINSNPW